MTKSALVPCWKMHPATVEVQARLLTYKDATLARDIDRLVRPVRLPPGMVKRQVVPEGKQPQALMPALLPSMMKRLESELANWEPTFPPGFINRVRDKWGPLFVVAEAAGVKWTRRAHLAAMALEPEEDHETPPG